MAFHLLVVDADANVTAQLPVVPTLEFDRFLWMFLTAGYWAHEGWGGWPLFNIRSAQNSVPLHNSVVKFDANFTEELFTILAAMFGLGVSTVFATWQTAVVIYKVSAVFEGGAEFRVRSHNALHTYVQLNCFFLFYSSLFSTVLM